MYIHRLKKRLWTSTVLSKEEPFWILEESLGFMQASFLMRSDSDAVKHPVWWSCGRSFHASRQTAMGSGDNRIHHRYPVNCWSPTSQGLQSANILSMHRTNPLSHTGERSCHCFDDDLWAHILVKSMYREQFNTLDCWRHTLVRHGHFLTMNLLPNCNFGRLIWQFPTLFHASDFFFLYFISSPQLNCSRPTCCLHISATTPVPPWAHTGCLDLWDGRCSSSYRLWTLMITRRKWENRQMSREI